MNSLLFLLQTALMYSTPIALAALGGLISERSGVINFALEGLMCFGALGGSIIAYYTKNPWLGVAASAVFGMALSSLHALASISFRANQVISSLAINFIGSSASIFLCRYFFEGSSTSRPIENKIPLVFNSSISMMSVLALCIAIVFHFILSYTRVGKQLWSVGEHPVAARSYGINPRLYQWCAVLISGIMAGVAGGAVTLSIVSSFRPEAVSGIGFVAVTAVIFGRWRVISTMSAAILFGFLQALIIFIAGAEWFSPYLHFARLLPILPYASTLLVLILLKGDMSAPKALGHQE